MTLRQLSRTLFLCCLGMGSTSAAEFLPITSVTSATESFDFYPAAGLIEGPGVGFDSAAPFNRIGATTWVTNDPNGGTGHYFEPLPDPAPKLTFDLGSDVSLAEISVWGYATGIEGNSLKDFSLRFATAAEGPDAAGTSITFQPAFTAASQAVQRQSFLFGQAVTARYVEFTPVSNYYLEGPGGDRVGFGEVAFEKLSTATSPLLDIPATVALGEVSTPQTIELTIRNLGSAELTLTNPVLGGPSAAGFTIAEVPPSLPAFGTGLVRIGFDPASLSLGPVSATFTVTTNNPTTPTSQVAISGSYVPVAEFYPVTSVTSTTEVTDFYFAPNLISGPDVGFSAAPPYNQIIVDGASSLWVTNAPWGFPSNYFEPVPDPAPQLTFDLGADVPLAEISIWGYSAGNSNGVRDFSLTFATAAEGPDSAGASITYNPTFTAQFGDTVRDSFDFTQTVTARYVLLTPINNWGNQNNIPGGDRVGIGEVAFEIPSTPPVTPASFDITAVSRNPQGQVSVTFNTQTGSVYTVYRSPDLTAWTPLPNPVNGNGSPATYTDTTEVPAQPGRVFYQVRAAVPQ